VIGDEISILISTRPQTSITATSRFHITSEIPRILIIDFVDKIAKLKERDDASSNIEG